MMTERSTTNDIAQQVLEKVEKSGANGDLIIDESESLSLKARNGEMEEYKVTSSRIIGLRVIICGQVGTAYSEAADTEALNSMVEQALTNAGYGKNEEYETIQPNNASLRTDDDLLCPAEQVSVEQQIEMALAIERELAARPKIKNVPYNGVQDITSQRNIFSSAGLNAFERSRSCSAYAYALAEDGEQNAMQGDMQLSRLFSELDPEAIVENAYQKSVGLLDGKPVPSKHYDVIFDEDCQASMFLVFSMMFSGKAAKDGINPMRDRVGEGIADSRISVFDQPLNTQGFGYSLFDAEGTATEKTGLIVDGQLQTLIHNSATAACLGTRATGHASRSPRSTLGVNLHQLEIVGGSDSMDSLHSEEYLEITDLSGLHSGANAISGDFSFGASGYLCRDGERVQPVRGITVAGNFYDMLKKIAMIGDRQLWNSSRSALMPTIRFSDIAISG